MNRAIIIGASGFLGRHVVGHLLDEGVEVHAVEHKHAIQANVSGTIRGGIKALGRDTINKIEPDFIFHCARPVMPSLKKWGRMIAARKAAKYNSWLIKELRHVTIKPKLVFASGSLMYGNAARPHDEYAPLMPISYARQYYKGELPLLKNIQQKEFPVIMIRFPWLLGLDSWFNWFYLNPILSHKLIPAFQPADNMMEIITVADAARIMVLYARNADAGIYNVPSPKVFAQQEFLDMLASKFSAGIADHTEVFGNSLEKEAKEAFQSNILLTTNYDDLLKDFNFMTVESALEKIRDKVFAK